MTLSRADRQRSRACTARRVIALLPLLPLLVSSRAAAQSEATARNTSPAGGGWDSPAPRTPPSAPQPAPVGPPSGRRRLTVIPSLRVTLGIGHHAAGQPAGDGLASDVTLGARIVTDSTTRASVWWGPEVGYSFVDTTVGAGHLFQAAFGGAYLVGDTGVALFPRFLVGSVGDRLALGFRASVQFLLVYGIFGLEAGYQFLHSDRGDLHDVVLNLFVDPGVLIGVLSGLDR